MSLNMPKMSVNTPVMSLNIPAEQKEESIYVSRFNLCKKNFAYDQECIFAIYSKDNCKPCKAIKPWIEEYLVDYEQLSSETITKSYYKENIGTLVPFFTFIMSKNGETIYKNSIQTSEWKTLLDFVVFCEAKVISVEKKVVLDDNF
jgi:arsenate reductase-like glutaredoxin family protein